MGEPPPYLPPWGPYWKGPERHTMQKPNGFCTLLPTKPALRVPVSFRAALGFRLGGRFRGSRRLPNWLRRGIRYGVGNDTPQRAQIDLRSLPRALQLGLQIGSKRSPKAARKGSGTRTAGLAKMYKNPWLRTLAICPGALFRTALATRMRSGAPRDLPGTPPHPGPAQDTPGTPSGTLSDLLPQAPPGIDL